MKQSYELIRCHNLCLVVTDGSVVLGMESKCVLLKAFGDVDAFPLCIKSHDV